MTDIDEILNEKESTYAEKNPRYRAPNSTWEDGFDNPIKEDPEFNDLKARAQLIGRNNPFKGIRNHTQYRELYFIYDLQRMANKHLSYCGQPYTLDEIRRLINSTKKEDIASNYGAPHTGKDVSDLQVLHSKRSQLIDELNSLNEQIEEFEKLEQQMAIHNKGKSK